MKIAELRLKPSRPSIVAATGSAAEACGRPFGQRTFPSTSSSTLSKCWRTCFDEVFDKVLDKVSSISSPKRA